jgi:hypothetical protein
VEIVADRAVGAHFAVPFGFGKRYADGILVDIETDIEQFFSRAYSA